MLVCSAAKGRSAGLAFMAQRAWLWIARLRPSQGSKASTKAASAGTVYLKTLLSRESAPPWPTLESAPKGVDTYARVPSTTLINRLPDRLSAGGLVALHPRFLHAPGNNDLLLERHEPAHNGEDRELRRYSCADSHNALATETKHCSPRGVSVEADLPWPRFSVTKSDNQSTRRCSAATCSWIP